MDDLQISQYRILFFLHWLKPLQSFGLLHSSLNFQKSVFKKFLFKSWSTESARKLAPNIVSGLVVNTFILFL